ncbi:MAG: winged helix-turn-helix transcriptional regulator [Psychrilyobacter sp.]|nr:winged helix-turn-helix transcriptional regulator [Psychrilyobacter sp.]
MERILGYQVGKLAHNIKKFIDRYLGEVCLGEGQYLILRSIINDCDISQKEISLKLDINKATTTKSIKKLMENEYITRERNIENPRYYKLICTAKAKKIVEEINGLINIEKLVLTKEISEKELEVFLLVLNKMNNNMLDELAREEKRVWR